jgi:uncharacterized DUF497 family protein
MAEREPLLEFEWDPAKAVANQRKHGISFGRAQGVFEDPQHLEEDANETSYGERRSKAVGRLDNVMITVIFTYRHGRRRIISARRARRDERERYRRRAEAV